MAEYDKTSNFLKAIDKYAKEQQKEIKSTATAFKRKELQKAEAEVLRDSYVLMQREMAQMRKNIDREVSKVEVQSKKELLNLRQKMMENVFFKAKNKLIAYTKTDDYKKLLVKMASKMSRVLKNDNITIFVREEDLVFKNDILKAFGSDCTIMKKSSIKIGGMLGLDNEAGIIVDETLDSKLENERSWFSENSGMSIV